MEALEELLGLLEDINEFVQKWTPGKTEYGKHFISRLMRLVTADVRCGSLHRAAVDTLNAIVAQSPANQKMVIGDQASWYEDKILLWTRAYLLMADLEIPIFAIRKGIQLIFTCRY
ncbi:hypothetical protein R1flu_003216 [Riccia fluitans]|uniref:Uncharacterized protein n=1 Tax=Riccia fluitans TaxID=41844 RepID=A0ABD1Y8P5_9MARC